MKLKLLFFAIIAFSKVEAQIPNSNFEEWVIVNGYDSLVLWNVTSDGTEYPTFHVHKDSDSYSGEYNLRLPRAAMTTVTAKCGFGLNYHPVFLHGFFKPDMSNKDTFRIKVSLFYANQLVDSGKWFSVEYVNFNYTPFSVVISQNSPSCDSAEIELAYTKNNPSTYYYYVNVDHLFFDDHSGIFSPSIYNVLQIGPNPCESAINIVNLPSAFTQFNLVIINQLGQQFDLGIMNRTYLASLDISFLPRGIYEMVLRDRHEIWTGRFLKQ